MQREYELNARGQYNQQSSKVPCSQTGTELWQSPHPSPHLLPFSSQPGTADKCALNLCKGVGALGLVFALQSQNQCHPQRTE